MAHPEWIRASRQDPCPICGKPDNCSLAADGGAVWCGRVDAGSLRQNGGGQFLHVLRERQFDAVRKWTPPPKPKRTAAVDLSGIARRAFEAPDAEAQRRTLAEQLGVSADALRRLEVGWLADDRQTCWTIPERDATGKIIGIHRRFPDGSKKQWSGSQRGLTFPLDWQTTPGPVLLVEGASDVAMLLSMNLCAIGRPSNSGGIELLVDLLDELPGDRSIVVVGEHDRKSHESLSPSIRERHKPDCRGCAQCWPGLWGATQGSMTLMQRLSRDVAWALAPDGQKDVRAWANAMRGGSTVGRT